MKKYTKDNGEVTIIKQLEDGFLVKKVLYEGYDEETDNDTEILSDETYFFKSEELYDNPVTEKLADEAAALLHSKIKLQEEIYQLQTAKRIQEQAQGNFKDWPFLQNVIDYLNGDFAYVLFLRDFEVRSKSSLYNSPYIYLAHFKEKGWQMFMMRSENYVSGSDDIQILIFKTIEEVNALSKKYLLDKIKNWKAAYYNSDSQFKEWFTGIHYSNKMKADLDVVAAFNEKYEELKRAENNKRRESLAKEIEELETKKKKLQELNAQ
jgi:hypothetical protein